MLNYQRKDKEEKNQHESDNADNEPHTHKKSEVLFPHT